MRKIWIFVLSVLVLFPRIGSCAPVVEIETNPSGTYVYMGGSVICELRGNRYLRFRSNPQNDHWIGQEKMPADIGWGYNDIKGYEHVSLEKRIAPGRFEIRLKGRKEIADCDQTTVVSGVWNEATGNFDYTVKSRIKADLEKWYQNSSWAKSSYKSKPDSPVQIEPMDFHLERVSQADRLYAGNHNQELYDCFLLSDDGKEWTRFPKFQVFYGQYTGDWKYRFNRPVGSYFGFVDRDEGGWLTKLAGSSGTSRIEICWFWLDIHHLINDGVPPRHSCKTFEAEQDWEYIKVTPKQAAKLIDGATEFPWRDLPEYRRPVYTRNNNFRTLVDGAQSQWNWRSSSPDCLWDDTVGYDDHQSVSIVRNSNNRHPLDAWYAEFQWYGHYMGFPFDWKAVDPEKTVCVSAMVKTAGVEGEARLAIVDTHSHAVLYSTRLPASKEPDKKHSESLTGDSDWTRLSICFKPTSQWTYISLELEGTGKAWFDNVVVEEVEEKSPLSSGKGGVEETRQTAACRSLE